MVQTTKLMSLEDVQPVDEDVNLSILVAILGARMHYAVPVSLSQQGSLSSFHTDVFIKSNSTGNLLRNFLNTASVRSFRELAGRSDEKLVSQQVHTYPLLGILYSLYLRMVRSTKLKEWGYTRFGSWFARSVTRSNMNAVDAIYACNGAALEMFEYAQTRYISCILEQIIAPYPVMRRLLDEEYSLWPEWEYLESQDQYSPLEMREVVWRFVLRVEGEPGTWVGSVDAHTGRILGFYDDNRYAQVKGGVFPVSDDGLCPDGCEQPNWPMPFANVTVGGTPGTANTMGLFSCVPGGSTATTTLAGPYVLVSDVCGPISQSVSCDSDLDLQTSPGTDCVVPAGASAGNTHASRTGFYHLNRIAEKGRSWLPANTWLQSQAGVWERVIKSNR